jgi:hypothetical protein
MVAIKIDKKLVEVVDKRCKGQTCFQLFNDKGTYSPGRGYTSYYAKPRWCCGTNHLHGCPTIGRCKICNTALAPYTNGVCEICHK